MTVLADPAARGWDFPRAVAGVALLVRHGRSRGVPAEAALAGSGLAAEDLLARDPAPEVTAAQELRVVRNLVRHLGPDAGAEVGRAYRAETFGAFGYALVASRTVLDAVDLALRFIDLSFTFAIPRAAVVGDRVVATVDAGGLPADVRAFLLARDATAIHTVLADLVPGGVGADLVVGERTATLSFAATELARPLPTGDARSLAVARSVCAEAARRRRERPGTVADVRVLVTQQLVHGAPMAVVAAGLGLSERTLRRRLAAAGTSYRAVVEEVRAGLACSLLAGPATMPVAGLAQRLGYADATSFGLAFRRWTGTSPAAYARAAR
ncbi:AraC family transcriptional regulator [Nocardioides pantholopis]|uniref:AraC family transcriptional regulator n=1 Tax=Nocardioides pantholopis TaxID=2483798 RepID=UPI000F0826D4|nr:AraC family transcriptional regulator [Nocardioides pantholopis]